MRRLLFPILLLSCAACSAALSPADAVQIRVANRSSLPFHQVVIGFPAGREEYGAVVPQGRTGYRQVAEAYRYAYVKVQAGGRELVLQPIDYVGETPLEAGRYTYVLGVDAAQENLTLVLRDDG